MTKQIRFRVGVVPFLFVSVRTIEGRLLRIYQKLGISSRAELAEVLNPRDGIAAAE